MACTLSSKPLPRLAVLARGCRPRRNLSSEGCDAGSGTIWGTSWISYYTALAPRSRDFLSKKTGCQTCFDADESDTESRSSGAASQDPRARKLLRRMVLLGTGALMGACSSSVAMGLLMLGCIVAATYLSDVQRATGHRHACDAEAQTCGAAADSQLRPLAALHALLLSMFNEHDLRRFVRFGGDGEAICAQLPGVGASLAELVDGVLEQICQRGLVRSTLMRLRATFPRRIADIEKVAKLWRRRATQG